MLTIICDVEKTGLARLKEALEAHEWESGAGGVDDLSDDFGLGSEEEDGFDAETAQMEREMVGLKMALHEEDESGAAGGAEDVEEMESMMVKVRAIKDMAGDMPETQRRRFAKKAIGNVLETL